MSSLYFNNAFAKKPLPESVQAMVPFLNEHFENPLTESEGADLARETLQVARQRVALVLHADASEIFFTSSGTESNNWALKGATWNRKRNHIIISAIEHFSVYQTAEYLQRQGCELTIIPVTREGFVDPDRISESVKPTTVLVSVQSASDEIGVIQNIRQIGALKQRFPEVLFHTDAVQFLCYEEFDVRSTPFDLISLSSNALYGPPGIAALYIRKNTRLLPLLHGGMQEEGLRPGLQSIALAAGFGKAAELNVERKENWKVCLRPLQKTLFGLFDELEIAITGRKTGRLVDNVHGVLDIDGEALLTLLLEREIQASSGSTCYQFAQKESHVLKALGIDSQQARGAVLFTLGIEQTEADIGFLSESIKVSVGHLRRLKP